MPSKIWEHFFKPEVRSSGRSLVTQGKVKLSHPSDTEILAYVRASTSFRITLKSESVESPTVYADCSCPLSKKGQFCKHIWATLLLAEEESPDFFQSKIDMQKGPQQGVSEAPKSKQSQERLESQEAYKAKQADYRKVQYLKQKLRLKESKNSKQSGSTAQQYPSQVESALKYFSENGFELRDSMTIDAISLAKKKLARIFHPDAGGTHEEILELNECSEVLLKYSDS